MNDLLTYLYSTGGTRRYHNRPELDQNTGKHSWGVALILAVLHPNPSPNLLKAATFHDCAEKVYGDILSPMKNDFPEAKELDRKCNEKFWKDLDGIDYPILNEEEALWLEYADVYECCLFTQGKDDFVYAYSLEKSRAIWHQLESLGYTK